MFAIPGIYVLIYVFLFTCIYRYIFTCIRRVGDSSAGGREGGDDPIHQRDSSAIYLFIYLYI